MQWGRGCEDWKETSQNQRTEARCGRNSPPVFPCLPKCVLGKPKADWCHIGEVRHPIRIQWYIIRECKGNTHAFFMDWPHFSMFVTHLFFNSGASGITFGAFRAGYPVSYGGLSPIFQKNLHFGSGACPVISSGLSSGASRAIMFRHGSSTAHLGLSVFSRVTPTW